MAHASKSGSPQEPELPGDSTKAPVFEVSGQYSMDTPEPRKTDEEVAQLLAGIVLPKPPEQ